jgi:hypothetical protein
MPTSCYLTQDSEYKWRKEYTGSKRGVLSSVAANNTSASARKKRESPTNQQLNKRWNHPHDTGPMFWIFETSKTMFIDGNEKKTNLEETKTRTPFGSGRDVGAGDVTGREVAGPSKNTEWTHSNQAPLPTATINHDYRSLSPIVSRRSLAGAQDIGQLQRDKRAFGIKHGGRFSGS